MENSLSVAKALRNKYRAKLGSDIDELKMHKLMCFIQRESLIEYGNVLFDEQFVGWRYGPVLLDVRSELNADRPFCDALESHAEATDLLIDRVLDRYGNISSWDLSILAHKELSWILSREGLAPSENGHERLSIDSMRIDAASELASRRSGM